MKTPQTICSLAAIAAFSTLTLPSAAAADSVPTYATHTRGGETVHGTIASLTSNGDVYVRDDRGYVDHVTLHQGTVIEPTGYQLASGDLVTISGQNAGPVLHADEIDAVPSGNDSVNGDTQTDYGDQGYAVDGGYPYGGYYPYGYGYPYGYDYGIGVYFGGGYGRGYGGYHGHGGYNGHGYAGHAGGYGGGYNRGGSRGFSGGGSRGSSGGGSHGGGGHR